MKKALKIIGVLLLLVVLFAVGGIIYLNSAFPKVGAAKEIKVEITPERLARGEYLAKNVSGCVDCHSMRDWSLYGGPRIPGTEGKGGEKFDKALAGIPGVVYPRNITPAGIGDWTDGELLRMITTGVNKKGEAMFPIMPYMHYRNMSQEDLYSIIAYIRSLKPIENKIPDRTLEFPMNLIVKTIPEPQPESFPSIPSKSDTIAYGQYMTNAATCFDCHTKLEKGKVIPGTEFSGGMTFCMNGNCVTSANITPDNETGIGLLSKEDFLNKFRFYRDSAANKIPVVDGKQTAMPWQFYCGMTDEDLGAIYAYLRTVPAVKHKVEKFTKQ
ncbi:MAG: cytochrome C [Bacteroidia bacterium]